MLLAAARIKHKTLTESGTFIVSSRTVIPFLNIARREAITMKGRCEFGIDSMRPRSRQKLVMASRAYARFSLDVYVSSLTSAIIAASFGLHPSL
jgi:hypothetical protein